MAEPQTTVFFDGMNRAVDGSMAYDEVVPLKERERDFVVEEPALAPEDLPEGRQDSRVARTPEHAALLALVRSLVCCGEAVRSKSRIHRWSVEQPCRGNLSTISFRLQPSSHAW